MAQDKTIKNASIVIIYSLAAKFSSFLVELLIGTKLGVSRETDAFYMVYGIVQIIYPMISVGIWKVFLPEYKTRIIIAGQTEADGITDQLLTFFLLAAGVVIAVIVTFPGGVVFLFAPGFDVETLLLSKSLLRIVSFIILFNTVATFSAAILQSWENFSKAQARDLIFHIPSLVYLLVRRSSCTVEGLAYSILAGSVVAAVSEYCFVREKYSFHLPRRILRKDVTDILRHVPAACINSVINQLNSVIDKIFASSLATGAVTCLNYGGRLIHLFDGIFSTAVSTALFPQITEYIAKNEYEKLKRFLRTYIVLLSTVILPVTALILLFSKEIVQIIFAHGKFDAESAEKTALVFLMYGLGLLLMCLTTIINDIFYILKRTRTLLITTIVNIGSNILLDIVFVKILAVAGLSLATTLSYIVSLGIKFYCIRDTFRIDRELVRHIVCIVVYCAVAAVVPMLMKMVLTFPALVSVLLGAGVFGLVYFLCLMVIDKKSKKLLTTAMAGFHERRGHL